jgi:hypothetical protein
MTLAQTESGRQAWLRRKSAAYTNAAATTAAEEMLAKTT